MRRIDYSKRFRFIELVLSNATNSDMMKEFGMSIQGVKWWLGTIYKELGFTNRKDMILSRSKFYGNLNDFITYREQQARLGMVEKYTQTKEPSKDLPKRFKKGVALRTLKQKELNLKKENEIPILPAGNRIF